MVTTIENQIAVGDPLRHDLPLPLQETFYPLGYPVRIATNDPRIIDIAHQGFGRYRSQVAAQPIDLRIAVTGGGNGVPSEAAFRMRNHLFSIVCDAQNFAMCDLAGGLGCAWITTAVAEARGWVRYRFLEAMIFTTLSYQRVTPVHAACVSRGGKGLLLAAVCGTGKTSLAYACARAGWSFVTDDVAYLEHAEGGCNALGKPYLIRFVEDAVNLFPELRSCERFRDFKGEVRIELETAASRGIEVSERCDVSRIVFLDRLSGGSARIAPVSRQEALERLGADMVRYEASVTERHLASLERLVERASCKLSYSNFQEAVLALGDLL